MRQEGIQPFICFVSAKVSECSLAYGILVEAQLICLSMYPWVSGLEFGVGGRTAYAMVRRVRAAHRLIVNTVAAKVRRKAESVR